MTFVEPLFLYGLLAALLPLVLHLWHRSRPRRVPWGAMALLRDSMRARRRRARLEQWLIVLIRMLVLALLALILARPRLAEVRSTGGDRLSIVVLDTSGSLQADGRMERARMASRRLLDSLEDGDAFALILAERPLRIFHAGPRGALDASWRRKLEASIAGVRAGRGEFALEPALEAATRLVSAHPERTVEVTFVLDRQARNWSPERERALGLWTEEQRARSRSSRLGWLDVSGPGSSNLENVSVDSLSIEESPVLAGRPVGVVARLSSTGIDGRTVPVSLWLDQVEIDTREVRLEGQEGTCAFEVTLPEAGEHRLEVRVPADALPFDDRFHVVITARASLEVLLVQPDRPDLRLEDGRTYLELALAPAEGSGPRPLGLTRIEPGALAGTDLENYSVIVLAGPRFLPPAAIPRLEGFVEGGGGLLLVGGPGVIPANWNRSLHRDGEGLLPFPVTSTEGHAEAAGAPAGLQIVEEEHPALEPLRRAGEDLALVRIRRWLALDLSTARSSTAAEVAKVLVTLGSGAPWLVESRRGAGRVILMSSSATGEWGNLALRPFFAPLCHELMAHLARGEERDGLSIVDGEPLTIRLPEEVPAPGPAIAPRIGLRLPGGEVTEVLAVERDGSWQLEYLATRHPGFISLIRDGQPTRHFAVNVDRRESDLDELPEAEVARLVGALGLELFPETTTWLESLEESRRGRAIWRELLALLVALLFVELLVVRRRPSRSPAGGTS